MVVSLTCSKDRLLFSRHVKRFVNMVRNTASLRTRQQIRSKFTKDLICVIFTLCKGEAFFSDFEIIVAFQVQYLNFVVCF